MQPVKERAMQTWCTPPNRHLKAHCQQPKPRWPALGTHDLPLTHLQKHPQRQQAPATASWLQGDLPGQGGSDRFPTHLATGSLQQATSRASVANIGKRVEDQTLAVHGTEDLLSEAGGWSWTSERTPSHTPVTTSLSTSVLSTEVLDMDSNR